MIIEDELYRVTVSDQTGAVTSLFLKKLNSDLIGEAALVSNFRICLPLKDYKANYIEGNQQRLASIKQRGPQEIEVIFSKLSSPHGEFAIDLSYTVSLREGSVVFRAKLTNHDSNPISEFWFPRLGGLTQFAGERKAIVQQPNFWGMQDKHLFKRFSGVRGLGAETGEFASSYPTGPMGMPWLNLYDVDTDYGLYLGYHDTTCRLSTWHWGLHPTASGRPANQWLSAEEALGRPVGVVFSHVRHPFIHSGETLDSGDFVVRCQRGDWHDAGTFYRTWFDQHFPMQPMTWLRKKSAWFTSIIFEPEDEINADYETYGRWCADAQKYGINTFEIVGWDKGGLERDYPNYVPEEKLGGREGFKKLMKSIDSGGGKCLAFVNYNFLDASTEEFPEKFKHLSQQDPFGHPVFLSGWGYSTLNARRELSMRRHVLSSVVPEMEEILAGHFEQIVRDGAHGIQIDKTTLDRCLDFNPLNTFKPDVALHEGLAQAHARLLKRLRAIDPEFAIASESFQDRLLPYIDVYYRDSNSRVASPLKYIFPEWTCCHHVFAPRDFAGVNAAVLTGAVIVVEPDTYQNTLADPMWHEMGRYIQEIERIRAGILDVIFLGRFMDKRGGKIIETEVKQTSSEEAAPIITPGAMPEPVSKPSAKPAGLDYSIHESIDGRRRAMVVVNDSGQDQAYRWEFIGRKIEQAELFTPFQPARRSRAGDVCVIGNETVHILVESE